MQNIWAYRVGAFRPGNNWHQVVSLPEQNNIDYLLGALRARELTGQISKLAIVVHGNAPGLAQTDPVMNQNSIFRDPIVCGFVSSLREYIVPSGSLIFFACFAGAGPVGSRFLSSLSTFIPGRTVIGFSTSAEFNHQYTTAGDLFDTGGAFVSGTVLHNLSREDLFARRMTQGSDSAKWAKDGVITRQSTPP